MSQGDKAGRVASNNRRRVRHLESMDKFRGIWQEEVKFRAWAAAQNPPTRRANAGSRGWQMIPGNHFSPNENFTAKS